MHTFIRHTYIYAAQFFAVRENQINYYDVTKPCPDKYEHCYDFTALEDYMNRTSTTNAFNLTDNTTWNACNRDVSIVSSSKSIVVG